MGDPDISKLCYYCSVLLTATRKHMRPWVTQGRRQLRLLATLGRPSARSLETWGTVGKNHGNGAKPLAFRERGSFHNLSARLAKMFFLLLLGKNFMWLIAIGDWDKILYWDVFCLKVALVAWAQRCLFHRGPI